MDVFCMYFPQCHIYHNIKIYFKIQLPSYETTIANIYLIKHLNVKYDYIKIKYLN